MPGKTTNVVSSVAEIQFILGLKCYAANQLNFIKNNHYVVRMAMASGG